MMLTMMAGFAELERNLIAERTASALGHMKAHRKVYSPTPFGYTREGDRLLVDPAEQDVLARMNRWRLEGWTLRKIAAELNQSGVKPKAGGKKWWPSTVLAILDNDLHQQKAA